MRMKLPSVAKKDIHVEVRDNNLVVSGQRKEERSEDEGGRHIIESKEESFYCSFPLSSEVRKDQIQAKYQDGMLEVILPKTEAANVRSVSVLDKADEAKAPETQKSAQDKYREKTAFRLMMRPCYQKVPTTFWYVRPIGL